MVACCLCAAAHRRQAGVAGTVDPLRRRAGIHQGLCHQRPRRPARRLGGSRAAAADRAVARDERGHHRGDSSVGTHRRRQRGAGADEISLYTRPSSGGARGDVACAGGLRRRRQRGRLRRFPGRSVADGEARRPAGVREARRRHVPDGAVGARSRSALERAGRAGDHSRHTGSRAIASAPDADARRHRRTGHPFGVDGDDEAESAPAWRRFSSSTLRRTT